jgi:regulator of protease activity HflC (stomatin/prohibitin superfamily)
VEIFLILAVVALAWWALWLILSLAKKDILIFLFLLITGVLWGFFDVTLALDYNPAAAVLLVIPIIILAPMLRIITEYDRGVMFRLGRQKMVLGPGPNLIFPLGIDRVRRIDLRTFTIDVPKQEVITKDNVPMLVDAVVYFNVFDSVLAVIKVADYTKSTSLLGQTILRSVLGQHDMDEILSKRTELNEVLRKILDEATDPWGIKITAVEIKAIELPDSMKRAMAKQAEAERERRAKIIAAEGELQSSEKLQQAAAVLGQAPAAIQLRYLQTLTEIAVEKNSTILFPLPIEILKFFTDKTEGKGRS